MEGARRPSRWAALAGALLLVACGSQAPTPATSAGHAFADRLRDAVDPAAIVSDLDTLAAIAQANGGTRAAGTPGYDASVDFVAAALRDLGYRVRLDTLTIPYFTEADTGTIEASGAPAFHAGRDFKAMIFSASGDLRARVVSVGFNRAADPVGFAAHATGSGCTAGELPASVRGAILLVQPGPCYRRAQAEAAQQAGAVAIVVAYPQWEPGFVLRPTLIYPDGIGIPVIGAAREVGLALADAADAGTTVHLATETSIVDRPAASVIADTPGGDPGRVVMLGGHLDSVIDGPGINDNGSGTMTILEIARRLAAIGPTTTTVRFAFWAGEEIGLYGSSQYVRGLASDELAAIEVYLNFDMLGSPNGGRLVYADADAAPGSGRVTELFESVLAAANLASERLDLSAASDQYPFAQAGVLTGGLFSGANEYKTEDQAATFGGTPRALFDACYHRACDLPANVDATLLEQMARTAAYVTGLLASGGAVAAT